MSVPWATRLVGRDTELAALQREYRRASAGEFRSVLLLADPGIGKTRLVREFLARPRTKTIALSARAYPLGENASFGVWSEALERHLRGLASTDVAEVCGGVLDDLAVLIRSVAAIRPPGLAQEPPRLRLLEGLATIIDNLASRMPLLCFLDDVHLADGSSWECLGYLARNISQARVLVVAAARPAELADHPTGTRITLGLEQEGFLARLELRPLDRDALGNLVQGVIGGPPPPALVAWLAQRSLGNPLFALGLLQALVDAGADFAAPELHSLPEELADRISTRLQDLNEAQLELLEVLATLGRRVDFATSEVLSVCQPSICHVPWNNSTARVWLSRWNVVPSSATKSRIRSSSRRFTSALGVRDVADCTGGSAAHYWLTLGPQRRLLTSRARLRLVTQKLSMHSLRPSEKPKPALRTVSLWHSSARWWSSFRQVTRGGLGWLTRSRGEPSGSSTTVRTRTPRLASTRCRPSIRSWMVRRMPRPGRPSSFAWPIFSAGARVIWPTPR
ncbi:MAG: AAA family ATPase [Chloroflexi bacterium]|nr:AAA family ATPase [Chloroflexota bacterium]